MVCRTYSRMRHQPGQRPRERSLCSCLGRGRQVPAFRCTTPTIRLGHSLRTALLNCPSIFAGVVDILETFLAFLAFQRARPHLPTPPVVPLAYLGISEPNHDHHGHGHVVHLCESILGANVLALAPVSRSPCFHFHYSLLRNPLRLRNVHPARDHCHYSILYAAGFYFSLFARLHCQHRSVKYIYGNDDDAGCACKTFLILVPNMQPSEQLFEMIQFDFRLLLCLNYRVANVLVSISLHFLHAFRAKLVISALDPWRQAVLIFMPHVCRIEAVGTLDTHRICLFFPKLDAFLVAKEGDCMTWRKNEVLCGVIVTYDRRINWLSYPIIESFKCFAVYGHRATRKHTQGVST